MTKNFNVKYKNEYELATNLIIRFIATRKF